VKERLHQRPLEHDALREGGVAGTGFGAARGAGGLANGRQHFVQVDRLGKVVERTVADRPDRLLDIGERGDQQHRQRRMILTHLPQHLQPGHARHAHIGDDHVDGPLLQLPQGLAAGVRQRNGEALSGQKGVEQTALPLVVIDNQDAGGRAGMMRVVHSPGAIDNVTERRN
jgi:hypothetical protein